MSEKRIFCVLRASVVHLTGPQGLRSAIMQPTSHLDRKASYGNDTGW